MNPKEFQDRFIDAFITAIRNNNTDLAEEYVGRMCEVAERVWCVRNRGNQEVMYTLNRLQKNCQKVFDAYTRSDNSNMKVICVEFLCNVYETLYKIILSSKLLSEQAHSKQASEHFLGQPAKTIVASATDKNSDRYEFKILDWANVHLFLTKILQEVNIKTLQQRRVSIPNLLINMQIVDLTLQEEEWQQKERKLQEKGRVSIPFNWVADYAITYLQLFMGWYLYRQQNDPMLRKASTEDNYKTFVSSFIIPTSLLDSTIEKTVSTDFININRKLHDYFKSVSPEIRAIFRREINIGNAIYVCGLIREGLSDEVKNVFHPKKYCNRSYYSDDNAREGSDKTREESKNGKIVYMLLPFCYLYCLGFWDASSSQKDEQLVKREDVRSTARQLAKDLSGQFKELLGKEDILKFLIKELKSSPKYYITQLMRKLAPSFIETAVKDFCLFSLLFSEMYISSMYWMLSKAPDINTSNTATKELFWLENPSLYIEYVKEGNDTAQKIRRFLEFMDIRDQQVGLTDWNVSENASNASVSGSTIQSVKITQEQRVKEMSEKLELAIKFKLIGKTQNSANASTTENVNLETPETSVIGKNEKIVFLDDDNGDNDSPADDLVPNSNPDSDPAAIPNNSVENSDSSDSVEAPSSCVKGSNNKHGEKGFSIGERKATLEEEVRKIINDNFGSEYLSINLTDDVAYKPAELLNVLVYTKDLTRYLKTDINSMANGAYLNLLFAYIQELIWRNKLEYKEDYCSFFVSKTVSSEDAKSMNDAAKAKIADTNYLNYLKEQDFDLMLGSKYLLSPRSMETAEAFDKQTKNYKWIIANGTPLSAVMRKGDVKFYIKNIEAHVDKATIKDVNHKIRTVPKSNTDSKTDSEIYEYEAIEGVWIPFQIKEELEKYIAEERRVIRVNAEIGVKIMNDKPVGICFSRW